jgi:hypothetical protein
MNTSIIQVSRVQEAFEFRSLFNSKINMSWKNNQLKHIFNNQASDSLPEE